MWLTTKSKFLLLLCYPLKNRRKEKQFQTKRKSGLRLRNALQQDEAEKVKALEDQIRKMVVLQ